MSKVKYFEAERGMNYVTGYKDLNWSAASGSYQRNIKRVSSRSTKRCG